MGKQDSSVKKNIKLSIRLRVLANLVTAGNRLADIGTDHGYIPIWLCQAGQIPAALAMDVREGPLSRAEAHIREYGLTDQIQTRLSDGMEELGEDEADTVLIAGMGGRLMLHILSETAIPESVAELVLQPQSDIYLIRRWIRKHGFRITDEDMVEEEGKYYPMMKAVRMAAALENDSFCDRYEQADERIPVVNDEQRTELEDHFGAILLEKRHPVLQRWLEKELKTTENIIVHLEQNGELQDGGSCFGENADDTGSFDTETAGKRIGLRRRELLHRKEMLLAALKYYR